MIYLSIRTLFMAVINCMRADVSIVRLVSDGRLLPSSGKVLYYSYSNWSSLPGHVTILVSLSRVSCFVTQDETPRVSKLDQNQIKTRLMQVEVIGIIDGWVEFITGQQGVTDLHYSLIQLATS